MRAGGSDSDGGRLSDIEVDDLLCSSEQAAEKEAVWLEMHQDYLEEQQRRQEQAAVTAAV